MSVYFVDINAFYGVTADGLNEYVVNILMTYGAWYYRINFHLVKITAWAVFFVLFRNGQ